MTRYGVNLVAIAEAYVEVEADDMDEAIELAFENAPMGANISNDFDMGEWLLAGDVWPGTKVEDSVEVLDD